MLKSSSSLLAKSYIIVGLCIYGPHLLNLILLIKLPGVEYCLWRSLTSDLTTIEFSSIFVFFFGYFINIRSSISLKIAKLLFTLTGTALLVLNALEFMEVFRYEFIYRNNCDAWFSRVIS